jgi:hypothetical protein
MQQVLTRFILHLVALAVYLQIGCGAIPSGRVSPTLNTSPLLLRLLLSCLATVLASVSASYWYSLQPREA